MLQACQRQSLHGIPIFLIPVQEAGRIGDLYNTQTQQSDFV